MAESSSDAAGGEETMRRRVAILAVGVTGAALLAPLPAGAHNAGHFTLPESTCHQVGSFKHHPRGLDLIPETPSPPFDEYGTSFAAFQGATPLLPGPCPA